MTSQALATATQQPSAQMLETVLLDGDLSKLTAGQRLEYYDRVCTSLGLNPLTKPFDYLRLNGKVILYAGRNCTDQLRATRHISSSVVAREKVDDVYVVTARAVMPDGRQDESIGAVPIGGLNGEALANAFMKAETKAKRRATLSLCGLSMVDESEVGSIPGAQPVKVDAETGEIVGEQQPAPRPAPAAQRREPAPTRIVDVTPVEAAPATPRTPSTPSDMAPFIKRHRERLRWDINRLDAYVIQHISPAGVARLTAEQAAQLINDLSDMLPDDPADNPAFDVQPAEA